MANGYCHIGRSGSGTLHFTYPGGRGASSSFARRSTPAGWYRCAYVINTLGGASVLKLGTKIDPLDEASRLEGTSVASRSAVSGATGGIRARRRAMAAGAAAAREKRAHYFARVLREAASRPNKRRSRKRTSR